MPPFRPGLGDHPGRKISHGPADAPHGYLEYRFTPGGGCEIVNIEVAGEHRRTGVGKRLLWELLRKRLQPETDVVWAVTRADNWVAGQWYSGMKFRVLGVLRHFYGRDQDAVCYGKLKDEAGEEWPR